MRSQQLYYGRIKHQLFPFITRLLLSYCVHQRCLSTFILSVDIYPSLQQ